MAKSSCSHVFDHWTRHVHTVMLYHASIRTYVKCSSVAMGGGMRGTCPPNPNPAGSWELPKSEEKKNWRRCGQYQIILIKPVWNMYFSYKIHFRNSTCHVRKHVFQILVFQLLHNSASKQAEQPWFFSYFTSSSCSLAKYTKLCTVWQPNICNMLWAFGGASFPEPHQGLCLWTPLGELPSPKPHTSKSWLHHWWNVITWFKSPYSLLDQSAVRLSKRYLPTLLVDLDLI